MIKAIEIANFQRLEGPVRIELGRVTVLVGANGSGKSSVLKAVHWATRCASLASGAKPGRVTLEQMDYVPSREFHALAHRQRLQAKARRGNPKKPVVVAFEDANGQRTTIEVSAVSNEAGVSAPADGPLADALTAEQPATAYIPGLAGLAEQETILAEPILRRKAASGEGGSVLRQLLLKLAAGDKGDTGAKEQEPGDLAEWVGNVIPGVTFWVKFDRRRDAVVEAWFLTPDMRIASGGNNATQRRPLEMAGTGLLQVTQIFAYLLHFKPTLLLIDEPDAHLHPSAQERLMRALEEAAEAFPQTQIILTTHAPRMVRAAGPDTRVVWMEDGKVRDTGASVAERMGWGALDKDVILFTEDENAAMLQALLQQWPEWSRRVAVWSCFGAGALPDGRKLAKFRERHRIGTLVHRDRDFMSDADVAKLREKKGWREEDLWVTPGSDIEDCFLDPKHIARALDIPLALAKRALDDAIAALDENESRNEFEDAYRAAVQSIPSGDRVAPGARYEELGRHGRATIKGKTLKRKLWKSLVKILRQEGFADRLGRKQRLCRGDRERPLAPCLKEALERAAPPV
ncbi:AAA family ATPase [Oceanicella actignis]|uniref:AAA ATPase domain-containing protein n=1 Tax=Oceanicella actignis TaxID=1189325 RepID=A0A1M7RRN2_9RHOB|nr:ATP-binding protein [Oceanicella actignis]SET06801.1 AAA domain-containing protein [Oceanicella actignis]SHN48914.1 AAA ATPase domain-containing protein [Oceanicella actignis]